MKEKKLREFMELAITESEKSISEDDNIHPKVGAVIVDEDGRVLARAHRGEIGKGDQMELPWAMHHGGVLIALAAIKKP